MARGPFQSVWHSRTKLAASTALLAVLIILIDVRGRDISIHTVETPVENVDDLLDDIGEAVEAIDYMSKLQKGTAPIRDIVEKEQSVSEFYWSCNIRPPGKINEKGWIENEDLFLFSAYYDDRVNSLYPDNDVIQVLSMSYRTLENTTKVYCNIFSSRKTAVVEGYVREIWQRAWDPRDTFFVPNLISCPVPNRLRSSSSYSVSITTTPCVSLESSFAVTIPTKAKEKKTVALCVKGMDFQEDVSIRLVEWLEAQYLFGIDDVTIYTYSVANKTKKVLDFYEKRGKLEQVHLILPGNSPNLPLVRSNYIWRNRQQKRRHEIIPYNDCLYRHLHTHRYILILDTDEIIVPLQHQSYKQLLEEVESNNKDKKLSSISARNVFKFPANVTAYGVPEYMHLLKHNYRSTKTSKKGEYGKSFTSTAHVATVFNHFALHRLSPSISKTIYLPEEVAVKLHYKEKCPIESRHECTELETDTVVDTSLDAYADKLTENTEKVMKQLGMFI